ncbi:hypothetical protein RND81_07G029900 [Saponaria officinalis]|uniref:Uncharacterized protein n=1 Tax=Saponaria officinalis TaxID=3572 RepID=A0AAW1JLS9_SAPOF
MGASQGISSSHPAVSISAPSGTPSSQAPYESQIHIILCLFADGEGNIKKVNDLIQPHDVWRAKGVRNCVTFNEFHHPLKMGGHILVRFIDDMARKERFCPIRETNWHHVREKFKVDIIKCIRTLHEHEAT